MGKGRWEVICVLLNGEYLYIPVRKIEPSEQPFDECYEMHRTAYLVPAEAVNASNWLNEHEENERSKNVVLQNR